MKVFSIEGYFIDDNAPFDGQLVTELDETPNNYNKDDIFWYGLGEHDIKQAIKNKEVIDDFIITDYKLEQEGK